MLSPMLNRHGHTAISVNTETTKTLHQNTMQTQAPLRSVNIYGPLAAQAAPFRQVCENLHVCNNKLMQA